jgi:hypothetical protein
MDKSREYVAMCQGSQNIQKMWKPAEGDYVFVSNNIEVVGYVPEKNSDTVYTNRILRYSDKPYNRKSHTMYWLPRQDQLWALIKEGKKLFDEYGLVIDKEQGAFEFVFFSPSGSALHMNYGRTEEQCLLEAYIQLNYRIKWNGIDWTDKGF